MTRFSRSYGFYLYPIPTCLGLKGFVVVVAYICCAVLQSIVTYMNTYKF
uniref:Uncharacterized protein n=1 Tax=Arundo donax TaxID=35708 RepID=A0A0A9FJ69_ARUDO